jgi:hypothetical protein
MNFCFWGQSFSPRCKITAAPEVGARFFMREIAECLIFLQYSVKILYIMRLLLQDVQSFALIFWSVSLNRVGDNGGDSVTLGTAKETTKRFKP